VPFIPIRSHPPLFYYRDKISQAGSFNTSTVALRVVGGDEREPSAWGYNRVTLFLGDINTGNWPFTWGSLESETVKCDESAGLRSEIDCAGEAQQQLKTTDASSRQRECYIRIITASVQFKNKNTGPESQGACCQDELFGGKPPVVK
jgi:hypothetical protein